jgi:LPXTG-motif cell wall-anchored protein
MKKNTTFTGPTGLARIRSLVAFRHQNPVARFISALVAIAIAMLLAVGPGAAYADDAAPAPDASTAATDTPADPAATDAPADTSTADASPSGGDSTAPSDPTPTDSTSPADTSPSDAPTGGATTDVRASSSSGPISTALKTLTASPAAGPNLCGAQVGPVLVGTFEIDGNTCVDAPGKVDWNSFVDDNSDTVNDILYTFDDAKDNTAYTQGDAERDDPAGFHTGGSSQGKDDITDAWSYTKIISTHVWTFFGVQRVSDNGTTTYDVELNHKTNSPHEQNPNRTAAVNGAGGDLLLQFQVNGTGPLTFDKAYQWTARADFDSPDCFGPSAPYGFGWCPLNTVTPPSFESSHSTDGLFAEGAIDLSALAAVNGGICTGSFGQMNIRTVASEEHTAALQDYVKPFPTDIGSTCGSIVIHKYADDGTTLIGGAHFTISPDPTPGSNSAGPVTLIDGGAGDADNTANGTITISPAEADSYTVTETQAPAGYLLPPASENPKTIPLASGAGQTATFNFTDPKRFDALTATKTAQGDYDTTFTWNITKGVRTGADAFAPTASKDSANLSESFDWKVSIGEGTRTESNHVVTGAITISNTNTSAVLATVAESLTGCTIYDPADTTPPLTPLADASGAAGFQVSVPANGGGSGTAYQYACTQADTSATSNTATISVVRGDYPRNQGDVGVTSSYNADATAGGTLSPSISWTEHPDGTKVISVTDVLQGTGTTHANSGAPWTHTWGDHADPTWNAGTSTYEHIYSSPVTATSGHCASVTNTATITDTGQFAEATATHCVGAKLVVSKNKTVSLTRTYLWQIHKTRTSAAQISSGQSADYSVTVDRADGAGYEDSGWTMTGVITVSNPNTWEPITMTSLVDVYSGDNDVPNSCSVDSSRVAGSPTWGAVDLSLDASQVMEYQYSCEFTHKPDYVGTNAATATWDAATAHTAADSGANSTSTGTATVADSDWDLAATPVNKVITVTDNAYTGGSGVGGHTLGTVDWDDAPHTFTYSIAWTSPAGQCETKPNTATIVETSQSSSASVLVCNALGLSVSKTADGDFTRTYPWTIEKFINTDQTSQTVHIDTFNHTFSYKVLVTPGTPVDSAWSVSGAITVTNDNSDPAIAPIGISTLLDDPSGSGESCTFDKGLPDHALVSGETYEVGYTCDLTAKSATNKATVTWAGGSADTDDVPVSWNPPTEVDKTIEVFDDKVNVSPAVDLGTATWNAEGTPTVFNYTKNLTVPESTAGSCAPPQTNTAWLGGDGSEPTNRKDSTDAIICVNAGTWSVSKVNVDGDGPIPTDSDVTYELTAHKTGGSNPKNVVLTDDLSDIAPYVDLPTQADLDAAAPAGSTATITGNLITWTIDELGATDQTLDFTVHVHADAYGVDLPNLVTSPGSDNCPNADAATAECKTDNDTPHYTLDKDSSAGDQVMPPYLGADGTLVTYTLTLHNDSDAPINSTTLPGAQVTDDLSDVLGDGNASLEGPIVASSGSAVMDVDGVTLRWTLGIIPPDGTATLTYQVRVNADQWDETLTNVAHPGDGGDCVAEGECTTTTVTPPYAQIKVLKVDDETGAGLAGAHFTLSHDGTQIGSEVVTDATGAATFPAKLEPGDFVVTETAAPAGYDLPVAGITSVVHVGLESLDDGAVPVVVTFRDPAQGQLTVLAKQQFERNPLTNAWVLSDGVVDFGDQIHYVVHVQATGKKLFHNVTATDYVPGYNPVDTTTSPAGTKAILDASSPSCTGDFTCTASVNAATGLVTWVLTSPGQPTGTVLADADGSATGTFEMTVSMPDIPGTSPIKTPGTSFAAALWNQGYLDWTQFDDALVRTELAAVTLTPHHLATNEVVVRASATLPPQAAPKPPKVLPNTGGPGTWPLAVGLLLLLGGGMLVASDRRRRRRS